MFISPAYAQASGGGTGGFEALLPLILIFIVFYFLLIRPQQKKMKQHRETIAAIRRGDKIVTGGGIFGSVTKVDNDHEITVEIAKDVKVKVRRDLISAVVSKTEQQPHKRLTMKSHAVECFRHYLALALSALTKRLKTNLPKILKRLLRIRRAVTCLKKTPVNWALLTNDLLLQMESHFCSRSLSVWPRVFGTQFF